MQVRYQARKGQFDNMSATEEGMVAILRRSLTLWTKIRFNDTDRPKGSKTTHNGMGTLMGKLRYATFLVFLLLVPVLSETG